MEEKLDLIKNEDNIPNDNIVIVSNNINDKKEKKVDINKKGALTQKHINKIVAGRINKCVGKIEYRKEIDGQLLNVKGACFFCKLPRINRVCLLTNYYIYNQDDLDLKGILNIQINENLTIKIDLSKKRFKYTNEKMGFTIIEIVESDLIDDYLDVDDSIYFKDYKGEKIYFLEYPSGQILNVLNGDIKDIKDLKIYHDVSTCSVGSPIISQNSDKVIGIHLGKKDNINIGINLKDIIDDILKKNPNIQNEEYEDINTKLLYKTIKLYIRFKHYLYILISFIIFIIFYFKISYFPQKLFYSNGKIKYYGYLQKGSYHGYGILYYEKGIIEYEGYWNYNNRKGNGTEYYTNGNKKYNGTWEKNKPCGYGISYYSNGNIQYNGNFIDGKAEGYGIKYDEDGELNYIGYFEKGEPDGFGSLYNNDGILIYEGSFTQGYFNGFGTKYYENGNVCYVGNWYLNMKNGTGISYYDNGNILYEGTWFNDTMDGFGTLFYQNKNIKYKGYMKQNKVDLMGTIYYDNEVIYYNGSLSEGQRFGNGTIYNKNGIIIYNGNFSHDMINGYGVLYYPNGGKKYEGFWNYGKRKFRGISYDINGYKENDGYWDKKSYEDEKELYYKTDNFIYGDNSKQNNQENQYTEKEDTIIYNHND